MTGTESADNPPAPTRIVGIGASAGGLAALEQFLERVPVHSGLAYIVVQHLDPTQKALLPELLQRVTPMRVQVAETLVRVDPDQVYVIPPNFDLSVIDGALSLGKPAEPRGLRLPINILFSSLARDQREHAIGVVLSGMGSDGTLGLQAIKTVGGLTLAQQPETAQFDSMPRSAIAAHCADIVAPPAEMPGRILAYTSKLPQAPAPTAAAIKPYDASADGLLPDILSVLQQHTRHDFSQYKPSTLHRRIERRMTIHPVATYAAYADFLRQNPQEIDLLFKELLIGVTSFFRDAAVWQQLAASTLPELLARRATEERLRAWVVGCSTGEEAYSLAMVFEEAAQRQPRPGKCTLQIFATDLSQDAIATARRGLYPQSIDADVPAERLAKFFSAQHGQYRINKSIRDMVLFAQQDVVLDPPFTRLDILSCRNLMIYFDGALQRQLLPVFHYSLRPGGVLLLGSSETIGRMDRLFAAIDAKQRLYLRQDVAANKAEVFVKSFPPLSKRATEAAVPTHKFPAAVGDSLEAAADHVLLQVHAPPAVVINSAGDIVYISGRTGKYLEPAAGKANWNFHAMVREGLRAPLANALTRVAAQSEAIQLRGLQVPVAGGVQIVDVTVQGLRDTGVLNNMAMIVFRDAGAPPSGRGRRSARGALAAANAAEVQQYRDEIQTLREENRASKEELQSANEELQSTNEELQSTNEELTTSKEEMQSMNEELQTVNTEMQTKLDDLWRAQSDLKNLLDSTEIAILFVDQDLNVRRYTERATTIMNLRDADVGRPFWDLTTRLCYPTLQDDARATLGTMVISEKQIATDDDRWFTVRIMPYRRLDNVVDGAVITFTDITATKALEAQLRRDAKT